MNLNPDVAISNFIGKKGTLTRVSTRYDTVEHPKMGDIFISISDTHGICKGHQLYLGTEVVTVSKVIPKSGIELTKPIELDHNGLGYLSATYEAKAIPSIRYQRITQDYLEYTRKLRYPTGTLITYGSEVEYNNTRFFTVGIDFSDGSLAAKLREINGSLTLYKEVSGAFNGFSYEATPTAIYTNIPVNYEYITSSLLLYEAGYTPSTIAYILLPTYYDINTGDVVEVDNYRYKVVDFNRHKYKNMLFLVVDYETTK